MGSVIVYFLKKIDATERNVTLVQLSVLTAGQTGGSRMRLIKYLL